MKLTYKTQSTLDYYDWCRRAHSSLLEIERCHGRKDGWYYWSRKRLHANHTRINRKKRKPRYVSECFIWDSVVRKFSNRLCRKVRENGEDQWSKWARRADTINQNIQTHRKGYGQEAQAAD